MKRSYFILLALVVIVVVSLAAHVQAAAPSTAIVEIRGSAYQPADVTIAAGGSVTWVNYDNVKHNVDFAGKASPSLGNKEMYTKKFEKKGTFEYTCDFHPSMKGKVTVV
jgi:plastocyanin